MLRLEHIVKGYNGENVLKGLDLTVKNGEFISIMGRSGSGKSTLLNILGGFMPADEGKVFWDNEDISSFSESKMAAKRCNDVGFVFQSFKLISTLNVEDNILLPASLSACDKKKIQKNFETYTKRLAIDGLLQKFPDQLSGGQCQRAAICRALCFEPSMLILDEPTGALDSESERIVMELLREINKSKKTTIIQVTHSRFVAEYAAKIYEMQDGRLV